MGVVGLTRMLAVISVSRPRVSEKEDGGPQTVHDQACSGEETATKSLHTAVDTNEDRKHDQIQLEAENVA